MSIDEKGIASFIAVQDKKHGAGTIITGKPQDVARYPLRLPSLNNILGGGIPKGRIVEIYGPEMSGKTTLSLMIAGDILSTGGSLLFVDAEHAIDPEWADKLGVPFGDSKVQLSQPDNGEQALEIVLDAVNAGFDVIIVDSVSALVPKAELEGEIGDSHMALQARLMSQAMRMLTGPISSKNTVVIFINQIREKIGVIYGSNETTTGGRALKFYASIRMDVRRVAQIKKDNKVIGARTKVRTVKNKTYPPFKQCEFSIGENGIDAKLDTIEMAVSLGIITKKGSWYSYGDTQFGQGLDKVSLFMTDEILKDIQDKINKENKAVEGVVNG